MFEIISKILEKIFHLIDNKKSIIIEETNQLVLHIETNNIKYKDLIFKLKKILIK